MKYSISINPRVEKIKKIEIIDSVTIKYEVDKKDMGKILLNDRINLTYVLKSSNLQGEHVSIYTSVPTAIEVEDGLFINTNESGTVVNLNSYEMIKCIKLDKDRNNWIIIKQIDRE